MPAGNRNAVIPPLIVERKTFLVACKLVSAIKLTYMTEALKDRHFCHKNDELT